MSMYFSAMTAQQRKEWIEVLTGPIIPKPGMEIDCGYLVPRTLAQLHKLLIKAEGFHVEGLFRLSGKESTMKRISEGLEKNAPVQVDSSDAHSIASLIKVRIEIKRRSSIVFKLACS